MKREASTHSLFLIEEIEVLLDYEIIKMSSSKMKRYSLLKREESEESFVPLDTSRRGYPESLILQNINFDLIELLDL